MKHIISKKARCPFYKHEDRQVVYCYGVTEGATTHVAFARGDEALKYKEEFCRKDYATCRIFKMLHDGGGCQ